MHRNFKSGHFAEDLDIKGINIIKEKGKCALLMCSPSSYLRLAVIKALE